ncbi:hypothetical protein CDG77_13965 [Nostoc sp. 'Peltigera membranacea cyanobiont' 213]|uniref:hypothetical protein n=1 Tax=Nostoc sp. 'Peltigera membranacea cyanobiont' 213 TaxID=2014530 RepID=UPI000B952664|nr:hypothetical protein [Nostoc sp. 'Peltigera membranacea cyanobiont' 213]OYD92756.1 hypothetical protein CDG77_13965 [Nostoc sp. 'Peltigera membranacea cyanobiont' 213]
MTYSEQLRQWAIFRRLPSGANVCVCRFRTRTDADAYTSILRQGEGVFEVVFDQPQGVTQG